MNILLTGATGFVGNAFIAEALKRGWRIRAAVRRMEANLPEGCETVLIEDMGPDTYWMAALEGIDAVVHLAARVHQLQDKEIDPSAAYYRTNVQATKRLAEQAALAGVKRFVFLSTVKIHGEGRNTPYAESDAPEPADPYALSKFIAEQDLAQIAKETGLCVTVLRPPLVYGEKVKANFHSLLRLVDRAPPLPFKALNNCRSLIYVGNLANAIAHCLDSEGAQNQIFLVSDQEDVSTPELVKRLASALGRPCRLWPIPSHALLCAARLCGKGAQAERLLESLAIDSSKITKLTGWTPPFTLNESLRRTAEWYRSVR